MAMDGVRIPHLLEAAGLERGFRILEGAKPAVRPEADFLLLRALQDIVILLGPMEGESWKVLSLLVRYEDNVSAVGRELRPQSPESGRRQVTRIRKKLVRLAKRVLKRAARIGRTSPPEYDLLKELIQARKAGKILKPSLVTGPGFSAFQKALLEIGRKLVDDPCLEAFGWRFVKAAEALNCPTPKTR